VIALGILFLLVPVVELAVIVRVSHAIGLGNTLGALLLLSLAGAWLVKHEGIGVFRRVQRQLERGAVPGREVVDGFLILLAGALMLTPGFVTDVVGLLLLFPPTRAVARGALFRRYRSRLEVYGPSATGRVYDVGSSEDPGPRDQPPHPSIER
jgi:UPF0716 protein FxsA